MANVKVISEWHSQRTDFLDFVELLKRGDRIEFQRAGYCHWAVYIGKLEIEDEDGRIRPQHMIVHRANPADQFNEQSFLNRISASSSKGYYGIGSVCMEPMTDIWEDSLARINNGFDDVISPYPQLQIVERCLDLVYGRQPTNRFTPYNLLTNNCEHFATWARNGWAISQQVTRTVCKVAGYGALAATALLPKPLALATGVGAMGFHAVSQMRRSGSSNSDNEIQE